MYSSLEQCCRLAPTSRLVGLCKALQSSVSIRQQQAGSVDECLLSWWCNVYMGCC